MTYLRLGLVIGVLLALAGAFFYGQRVGRARCESAYAQKANAARAEQAKRDSAAQVQDTAGAAANVERETIVREITREVPKIVDRPVYRNVCVDADGVRLIERAVDAANGTPSGRSDGGAGAVQPATGDGKR